MAAGIHNPNTSKWYEETILKQNPTVVNVAPTARGMVPRFHGKYIPALVPMTNSVQKVQDSKRIGGSFVRHVAPKRAARV
ncbi:hypothetical protein FRC16_000371 [Serendipita sp. 398]|nr:hypothetical protein FRC16_000371 [Serendipita sp. 398]